MGAVGRDKILTIGLDACEPSFIQSRKAQLPLLAKAHGSEVFLMSAACRRISDGVSVQAQGKRDGVNRPWGPCDVQRSNWVRFCEIN
jgi:hypothetical protein